MIYLLLLLLCCMMFRLLFMDCCIKKKQKKKIVYNFCEGCSGKGSSTVCCNRGWYRLKKNARCLECQKYCKMTECKKCLGLGYLE